MSSNDDPTANSLIGPTVNLIIACVGAGVLSFPFAIKQAGLVLGILFSISLASLNMHSNRIIARQSAPIFQSDPEYAIALQRVRTIEGGNKLINTEDRSIRVKSMVDCCHLRLGKVYGRITQFCLFVSTLGALIGYLIIIGDLLTPVLQEIFGSGDSFFTSRLFVILAFVLFIAFPLSTIPDLEGLVISSIIAVTTVLFVALVVVIQSCSAGFPIDKAHAGPESFSSAVTSIPLMIFAFSCNVQVSPVLAEMPWDSVENKTMRDMSSCIQRAMTFCAALYIIMGVFGYVQFREDTDGVILDNYNTNSILAGLARFSMVVHIALAYPVILYPAQQNFVAAFLLPLYNSFTSASPTEEFTITTNLAENSLLSSTESVLHANNSSSFFTESTVSPPKSSFHVEAERTSTVTPPILNLAPLPLRIFSALSIAFCTSLVAIVLPQAEVVFGLTGALLGSILVLILPASLAIKHECSGQDTATISYRWASYMMFLFGLFIATFGTYLYVIQIV
jgi:amino acid permease